MAELTKRRKAAHEYIKKYGFSVLLLEDEKKEPASKHGVKDATRDIKKLNWAWEVFPNADYNIGIATGAPSGGLLVIDCDINKDAGKDGWEWLLDWQLEHDKLPETATVQTGSGGMHLYFRNKTGRTIRNSANSKIGVDVRSDGGYVMARPLSTLMVTWCSGTRLLMR